MFEAWIECPRCHQLIMVPQGNPDAECDCHLWCSEGDEPSDCSMTIVNYTGPLGWPVGSHQNSENEGDDILHRTYYCSIHKKYTYKQQIQIPVDWKKWYSTRASARIRTMKNA